MIFHLIKFIDHELLYVYKLIEYMQNKFFFSLLDT